MSKYPPSCKKSFPKSTYVSVNSRLNTAMNGQKGRKKPKPRRISCVARGISPSSPSAPSARLCASDSGVSDAHRGGTAGRGGRAGAVFAASPALAAACSNCSVCAAVMPRRFNSRLNALAVSSSLPEGAASVKKWRQSVRWWHRQVCAHHTFAPRLVAGSPRAHSCPLSLAAQARPHGCWSASCGNL